MSWDLSSIFLRGLDKFVEECNVPLAQIMGSVVGSDQRIQLLDLEVPAGFEMTCDR
jgi:hypothetical protein